MSDNTTAREMTLDEWVDRLPVTHRARKELIALRKAEAELATLQGIINPLMVRLGVDMPGAILSTVSALKAELAKCEKKLDIRRKGHEACMIENDKLEAELAAIKQKTYCAYCGKEYPIDSDGSEISEHIKTCEDHPMREVEADLADCYNSSNVIIKKWSQDYIDLEAENIRLLAALREEESTSYDLKAELKNVRASERVYRSNMGSWIDKCKTLEAELAKYKAIPVEAIEEENGRLREALEKIEMHAGNPVAVRQITRDALKGQNRLGIAYDSCGVSDE